MCVKDEKERKIRKQPLKDKGKQGGKEEEG